MLLVPHTAPPTTWWSHSSVCSCRLHTRPQACWYTAAGYPSAQVLLHLHTGIPEHSCSSTHCRCLHVYTTRGGMIHPTPQHHPINTQPNSQKCHTAASQQVPLWSCAGDSYAACEKPLGESILENGLLQRRLDIFSDSAHQLSSPFITETHQVFYLLHTVCGASGWWYLLALCSTEKIPLMHERAWCPWAPSLPQYLMEGLLP